MSELDAEHNQSFEADQGRQITEQGVALTEQMRAITISREYGSGGGEVARRLATRLGWQLVDHEMVIRLAQRLNISEYEAAAYDEHSAGLLERMLMSMRAIDPSMLVNVAGNSMNSEEVYHQALHQVVVAAAQQRHVIIIGRGSQIVLRNYRDVLNVRIVAPLEQCITYVMQREGLNYDDAKSRIQMKDRDRKRYLHAQYHIDNDDPHLYDMILNTGVVDLDSVVDLICLALERKSSRLSLPIDAVGPVASANSPYPGQPGDIRPPASMQ